jgi:hypothetical protein
MAAKPIAAVPSRLAAHQAVASSALSSEGGRLGGSAAGQAAAQRVGGGRGRESAGRAAARLFPGPPRLRWGPEWAFLIAQGIA